MGEQIGAIAFTMPGALFFATNDAYRSLLLEIVSPLLHTNLA